MGKAKLPKKDSQSHGIWIQEELMGLFRRCVESGNHVRPLHALIIKTKLRDPHPLQIKKRKYQNNLVRDMDIPSYFKYSSYYSYFVAETDEAKNQAKPAQAALRPIGIALEDVRIKHWYFKGFILVLT